MHPEFYGIIDDNIELRNRYYPRCQNKCADKRYAPQQAEVFEALQKDVNPIVKSIGTR
jgi:hypothetical protein